MVRGGSAGRLGVVSRAGVPRLALFLHGRARAGLRVRPGLVATQVSRVGFSSTPTWLLTSVATRVPPVVTVVPVFLG